MDTWINGYSAPKLDDKQDIYDAKGSIKNGVTILEFTRKRITDDDNDVSFTDDHCLHLLFPINGGAFNAVNKKIRKHEGIPFVTEQRVCIKSCGLDVEQFNEVATTQAPNRLVYAVGVKLMKLAEGFDAPIKGSPAFDDLSNTVSDTFKGVLNTIPGYYKIDVQEFQK
jgi:hypothetical protein